MPPEMAEADIASGGQFLARDPAQSTPGIRSPACSPRRAMPGPGTTAADDRLTGMPTDSASSMISMHRCSICAADSPQAAAAMHPPLTPATAEMTSCFASAFAQNVLHVKSPASRVYRFNCQLKISISYASPLNNSRRVRSESAYIRAQGSICFFGLFCATSLRWFSYGATCWYQAFQVDRHAVYACHHMLMPNTI